MADADVPSLVSADSLVMFDPHARYVPGSTIGQPGIRIRFAMSSADAAARPSIVDQFPDQFRPYELFGCTLRERYNGTLFRFPLRHARAAAESAIKQAALEPARLVSLLQDFRANAIQSLLFLRNVKSIRVMVMGAEGPVDIGIDTVPRALPPADSADGTTAGGGDAESKESATAEPEQRLCYDVSIVERRAIADDGSPCENAGSRSWDALTDFVTGAGEPEANRTRDAFYARLANTATTELPHTTHVVHGQLRVGDADVWGKLGKIAARASGVVGATSQALPPNSVHDERFLVCSELGGGTSRDMSVRDDLRELKLVPWAGVAAPLSRPVGMSRHGEHHGPGRAFCFLPLPLQTGLPVHVRCAVCSPLLFVPGLIVGEAVCYR